jgi:ATP-binding cassette, subfamily B, bacterial PglK
MLSLLDFAERKQFLLLALLLPFLGMIDALGLAYAIAAFLHITELNQIPLIGILLAELAERIPGAFSQKSICVASIIFIACFRLAASVGAQYWIYRFTYSVQARLSSAILHRILAANLEYLSSKDKAYGVQYVFSECGRFSTGVLLNAFQIWYELLTLLVYFTVLFVANPGLSLVFSISAAIIYGIVRLSTRRFIERLGNLRIKFDGMRMSLINESVIGVQEVECYGLIEGFSDRYRVATDASLRATVANQVLNIFPKYLFEILLIAAMIYVALLNEGSIKANEITTLGLFLGGAFRCLPSINRILTCKQMMTFEFPVVAQLQEELRKLDLASRRPVNTLTQLNSSRINGCGDRVVIPPFNYVRKHGDKVFKIETPKIELAKEDLAIVLGESGSGKSTFLGCLTGLLGTASNFTNQPNGPMVFRVSYAPQTSFVLNGSLEENVTLSTLLGGLVSDKARLNEVLTVAQMVDKKSGKLFLPLEHILDGSGGTLSGGQRQKLALARALYFQSDLLILDEVTANLDEDSEREFFNDYLKSSLRRATVFVTHRSRLASLATRIFRMRNGVLVEEI